MKMKWQAGLLVVSALLVSIRPIGDRVVSKAATTPASADSTSISAAGGAAQVSYGLNNPTTDGDGVTTWDCVWFGSYWQEDTNGDGKANKSDAKQPIKWRVLSVNGDDAFLLADKCLNCQRYNDTNTSVTWETCTMRSWLNGYGAAYNNEGKDYGSNNFLNNAFSAGEQSAIRTTNVVNNNNFKFGTEGGNDTSDKVYLLSLEEVMNPVYGFSQDYSKYDESRRAKNTAYAEAQGAYTSTFTEYAGNSLWWLRSPGSGSRSAASVESDGNVPWTGDSVDYYGGAVRPALHLNLSSTSSWSYAGIVTSEGGEIGTATPAPEVTFEPTFVPTEKPDVPPTEKPSVKPVATPNPTVEPSATPTASPGTEHSPTPTLPSVTSAPTEKPSVPPTDSPSVSPTATTKPGGESFEPTFVPTEKPDVIPTEKPSVPPTDSPSVSPTATTKPGGESFEPTFVPTEKPDVTPTEKPSVKPVATPNPTVEPSATPTTNPGTEHSPNPTLPSVTSAPTEKPAVPPTDSPSVSPTATTKPSSEPTMKPAVTATTTPTAIPIAKPTNTPGAVIPFVPTPPSQTLVPVLPPQESPAVAGVGRVASIKLTQKKQTVTALWKKVPGAAGYQIWYSTSKKWKGKKQKLLRKNKVTLKSLKKKKTYYFRVRAYRLNGTEKVYGAWSKTKKITMKK